jgi:hypothetical protein
MVNDVGNLLDGQFDAEIAITLGGPLGAIAALDTTSLWQAPDRRGENVECWLGTWADSARMA